MSIRKRLQITLAALTVVVLGLAGVTLWATLQWQRSDHELREHYHRSLLLQEVRSATFHALREASDAVARHDGSSRMHFESLLVEAENDFRAWSALAHSAAEQQQVDEVRGAYAALTSHTGQVFDLLADGRFAAAAALRATQVEGIDFQTFESRSARAVASDNDYRRHIQRTSARTRQVAQVSLATASALTVGLVALLGYYFTSGLLRPLREVEDALGALGRGDLQRRIPETADHRAPRPHANDELRMLVHAFNRTVSDLGRTTVSKAYVDRIIESMVDALVVAAPDGRIRIVNPAAAALFGRSRDELVGRDVAEVLPTDDGEPRRTACDIETTIRASNGHETPVRLSRSVITSNDGVDLGTAFVAHDIAERKRADAQIRLAFEEKEVLFKEINHRVKNNLQIIDSLLSLQSRQAADGGALLQESRDRIRAMALVHEMLYRSDTPTRIDLRDYLHHLTSHLMRSYGGEERQIRLAAGSGPASLGLDAAIPCGLIINELVTNALKHAFPSSGGGEIVVELEADADNRYHLAVHDNGVGLPATLDVDSARSLGLRLVRTLTEQIGGRLRVDNQGGARFEITFSV